MNGFFHLAPAVGTQGLRDSPEAGTESQQGLPVVRWEQEHRCGPNTKPRELGRQTWLPLSPAPSFW